MITYRRVLVPFLYCIAYLMPLAGLSPPTIALDIDDVPVIVPLRCLEASANIFKDTDHPFRWFLAPYAHLFVLDSSSPSTWDRLEAWVRERRAAELSGPSSDSALPRRAYSADWLVVCVGDADVAALAAAGVPDECAVCLGPRAALLASPPRGALPDHAPSLDALHRKIGACVAASYHRRLSYTQNSPAAITYIASVLYAL